MNKLTPENQQILKRATATFIHNGDDPTIKLTIILAPEEFALAIQNATAQRYTGTKMPLQVELLEDEDGAPYPDEVQDVVRKLAELKSTFDLRWDADMRAIKRWQQAHPGQENVWPDHADLVVWLLAELEA